MKNKIDNDEILKECEEIHFQGSDMKQSPSEATENYMSIIPQSDDEKFEMYMKLPKEDIAKMLVSCNKALDGILPIVSVESPSEEGKEKWISFKTQKPEDYQQVLIWDSRDKFMSVGYFVPSQTEIPSYNTHWMILPNPPKT